MTTVIVPLHIQHTQQQNHCHRQVTIKPTNYLGFQTGQHKPFPFLLLGLNLKFHFPYQFCAFFGRIYYIIYSICDTPCK